MSDSMPATTTRCIIALTAGALLAAGTAVPRRAPAQGVPDGALRPEAALSGAYLAGSDFESAGAGLGAELGARYGLTPRLSLGLLGQAAWHGTDGLDGPLRLLGVALEPRYRLVGSRSGLVPFVGARVGVARWSATESADSLVADVRADGIQAGGTVGVAYALSQSATLEAAAVASYLSFGDARVDASLGEPIPPFTRENSGATGSLLGLRASLRVRLP